MFRVALRTAVLTVSSAVVTSLVAAPALADAAPVTVTLTPTYGLVGSTLDVHADAGGLTHVTSVMFTGAASSTPRSASDASSSTVDTDVHVTVPADADSGALTLTYDDSSTRVTDQSFTVQRLTSATATVSRQAVVFPRHAVVHARLRAAGAPVSGQPARLQRKAPGRAWHNAQQLRQTSSGGTVSWTVAPSAATVYRVVFRDVPAFLGSSTHGVRVNVAPRVSLHVPGIVPILTRTTVSGRVRPAPVHHGAVVLEQKSGGAWHRVATIRTRKHGTFSAHVSLPGTGSYAYRVRRPQDGGHRSGLSTTHRVKAVARSLHSGMSGPDVTTLQKRLRRLHYDLGHVTGTFNFDTVHAVIAFEKVQRLSRDGVVGVKVWRALQHPKRPHLRHPGDAATAGVEVDLARQVVLYAVHGHIVRILDSSTGGGYYYTGSDGTQQKAVTPTGHFAVVYQRSGWVTSKLGTLYRPAYFNNDGYAIHGETEVPSYPASHGCVRITVPARDRLGSRLYDGLSVWIY